MPQKLIQLTKSNDVGGDLLSQIKAIFLGQLEQSGTTPEITNFLRRFARSTKMVYEALK